MTADFSDESPESSEFDGGSMPSPIEDAATRVPGPDSRESGGEKYFLILITETDRPKYREYSDRDGFIGALKAAREYCRTADWWTELFAFKGTRILIGERRSLQRIDFGDGAVDVEILD